MPDQTNISDFDPATGRTTTTLVSTHTRGAQEEAARDGAEHATWHRNDMAGGGTPPAAPVITGVTPATVVQNIATPLTVIGTGFVSGHVVFSTGAGSLPTTFVSATELHATITHPFVGATTVQVNTAGGAPASNTFPITVSATMGDPSQFTIDEIKTWIDDHADQADEVLSAEEARGDDARTTLVTWLQGFIAHRDED
jgi:hypothetical protein